MAQLRWHHLVARLLDVWIIALPMIASAALVGGMLRATSRRRGLARKSKADYMISTDSP